MIAYLTIDDAPSRGWRAKLDALETFGIRAILFCAGRALSERPEFVAPALAAGHVLGNHAWSHPAFSEIPLDACEREIDRTHRLLVDLHRAAGREFEPRYFRFPYGDKGALTGSDTDARPDEAGSARKAAIQQMLRSRGYTQPRFPGVTYRWYRDQGLLSDGDWYWTYDCHDWSTTARQPQFGIRTLEDVFARMDEDVPEGGRGLHYAGSEDIVLLHDDDATAELFVPIIQRLLEIGVEFRLPG
ncbi:MAG: polysaccharide deacetylase family protein [Spirochaetota bacterium]